MVINYYKEDKILKVNISEEIDHHSAEKIKQKIDYEIETHMPKRVVFDFNGVKFMDSAGIGLIIGRYKLINMLNGELKLINVNRYTKKIFEMSGILNIIPIIEEGENEYGKCV